jgi:hypothetical protein
MAEEHGPLLKLCCRGFSFQAGQIVKTDPPPWFVHGFDSGPDRVCLLSRKREYLRKPHKLVPIILAYILRVATNSCAAPPQPERGLVRKQLSEPKHHAIDKREEEVDCGAAENGPECRRLVEDDGWGRR